MSQNKLTNNFKKTICRSLAFLIFFSSLQALSAIPYRHAFEQTELINRDTKELNLDLFAKMQILVEQQQLDMAKYIPYSNLPQNSSGEIVSGRIVRKTLKTFLDAEQLSNAPIVRGAATVQNSLGTSMGTTEHQFSFRINAIETQAEVKYKGLVEAKLSYQLNTLDTQFELAKQLGAQTYAYTHSQTSEGFANNLAVSWSF